MNINKKWRAAVFVCCVAALAICTALMQHSDENRYFDVAVLSEWQYSRLTPAADDVNVTLFLDGLEAPLDKYTDTLYLPHKINGSSLGENSAGTLAVYEKDYRLCFAPDSAFDCLGAAMAENHPFRLLLVKNSRICKEYTVFFTDLPVITMEGDVTGIHEGGREQYTGTFTVWDPCDAQLGQYKTQQCGLEWHVRGQTVSQNPKKSWKVTMLNGKGTGKNVSLLGLGEDDDWIFNAMYMDDLKFREKLIMELWKQMCADNPQNVKMSDGEYAEIICNGKYQGLYLVQRRVDRKYLELGQDTILVKGRKVYEPQSAEEAYEIIYSSMSEAEAYEFLNRETIRSNNYMSHMEFSCWSDVSMIMSFGALSDNYSNNNNFMLIENTDGDYTAKYILWDTDMAFGLTWSDGFAYIPGDMVSELKSKKERGVLRDMHEEMHRYNYDRWCCLRGNILSSENLARIITEQNTRLQQSGAWQRDVAVHGLRYDGEDTVENLYRFIGAKTAMLEEYYRGKAQG